MSGKIMSGRSIVGAVAVIAVSLLAPLGVQAEADRADSEKARLVVYRADESSRTRNIKFDASVDGVRLERLKYRTPIIALVSPGSVRLGTSIRGTEDLRLDLQAGRTYYVHIRLKKLGQTVKPSLVQVEEQVALSQRPAIEGMI